MEPATAFENFRILNDGIKAMLVAMPPVTLFAFTALFLDHRRRVQSAKKPKGSDFFSPEVNRDHAPINLQLSAPERHTEMRGIVEDIRTRCSTWKKRD